MSQISELKSALENILNTPSKLIEYNGNSLQIVHEKIASLLATRGTVLLNNTASFSNLPPSEATLVVVKNTGVFYYSETGTATPPQSYEALGGGVWIKAFSNGSDGKDAYEIAVDNGFEGTVEEWLDSLIGPTGPTGPQGPKGDKGDKGDSGNNLRIEGRLDSSSDLPANPDDSIGAYLIPDTEDPSLTNVWVWNIGEQQWENAGPFTTAGDNFDYPAPFFDTEDTTNVFLGDELTDTSYIYPEAFLTTPNVENLGGGTWDNNSVVDNIVFDKYISGNGELKNTVSTQNIFIGLDKDFKLEGYTLWDYCLNADPDGNYKVYSNGEGQDTGIAWSAGHFSRLIRTGDTVKAQYSTNSGSSWTDLHTFELTYDGDLYMKAGWGPGSLQMQGIQCKKN